MDHQQNYEFNDPNSFGFINSFTGSDNFILAQPQQGQLNGKDHPKPSALPTLTTNFDPITTVTSQFITQSAHIMYDLPETTIAPPTDPYPNAISYLSMTPVAPEISLNSQKDSLFNLESSPAADIIQQNETEVTLPLQTEIVPPSFQSIEPFISKEESALKETKDSESLSKLPNDTLPEAEITEEPTSSRVSPEQNNIMKALGVMKKEALASIAGSRKRRRRIFQLNEDDSDDENELKREVLQISPEKDKEKTQNDENETEDSTPDSDSDDPSVDPCTLKVRSLLKSAVIIQGPERKKKKRRVLESDDEDEMQTSVDDIGLMESNENENEIDDELFNSDIIVSETTFETIDGNEKIISIESPLIVQDEFVVPVPPASLTDQSTILVIEEKLPEAEVILVTSLVVKDENENKTSVNVEEPKTIIKSEDGEIDPSMSVEAILEKIKPMADDEYVFKTKFSQN